jgi:hypothetical protein
MRLETRDMTSSKPGAEICGGLKLGLGTKKAPNRSGSLRLRDASKKGP